MNPNMHFRFFKSIQFLPWLVLAFACGFLCACGGDSNAALATFGDANANGGGFSIPVSDDFGPDQAQKLYDQITSPDFHAALAKYTCGDPVPDFTYHLVLYRKTADSTRLVAVSYSINISPAGHQRGLLFGLSYLAIKDAGQLDPTKSWTATYQKPGGQTYQVTSSYDDNEEPICDCANRDSGQEWVTFASKDKQ